MKIKLQKISTTKTQQAFMLSFISSYVDGEETKHIKTNEVFMTNTEENNKFWMTELSSYYGTQSNGPKQTCKYNKNSLYDKNLSVVYYPMYNSKQPYYKSAIYKCGKSMRTGTTYDFQDITNHTLSSELFDICHIDNIMYAIEPKCQYGRYELDRDVWSWLSVDHGYAALPLKKIDTMTYKVDKLKEVLDTPANVNLCADNIVKDTFTNIQYNMLYEINGNIYNDYEGGNVAANTFKAKNQYNCTYDMLHDNGNILTDARDYVGIGNCNTILYLKYYDNVFYTDNEALPCETEDKKNKFGFCYPNIEVVKAINRYESFNAHKTNLYSIVVKTDILKNAREYINKMIMAYGISMEDKEAAKAIQDKIEQVLKNISLEIANGVKSIAESLQPAHTQLYSIYVK